MECVTFISAGTKVRRFTDDEIRRIENIKRNLRDEDISIHCITPGKYTLTYGTKVQEVAGDVETDEVEHGKSTLTDSVLAAAGTKVREVADDYY